MQGGAGWRPRNAETHFSKLETQRSAFLFDDLGLYALSTQVFVQRFDVCFPFKLFQGKSLLIVRPQPLFLFAQSVKRPHATTDKGRLQSPS